MGNAFLHGFGAGGGGAGNTGTLNFVIAGGTVQPADPAENTIWVNTEAEITGYVFDVTEPEAPSEGLVWIYTGNSSAVAFNALTEGTIQIYPISCRQYVSGAWADKTALSYLNGAWEEWIKWDVLYDTGDQNAAVTGGWDVGEGPATASIDADYMTMTTASDAKKRIHVATNNAVSLANYSTLNATVQVVNVDKGGQTQPVLRLGYADSRDISLADATDKTEVNVTAAGEMTISMDISAATGSKYVIVGIGFYELTVRVTRVWME